MSRKSLLGGIAPLYQAQEPSLLLMQAKCLACCPLTVFSSTQSNHRHSAGLLIMQGMEVQRVIWNNQRNTKDKGINLQKKNQCIFQDNCSYSTSNDYLSTLPCNHNPFHSAEPGSSSGWHSWTPRAQWSHTVWHASSHQPPVCLSCYYSAQDTVRCHETWHGDVPTAFICLNVWCVAW